MKKTISKTDIKEYEDETFHTKNQDWALNFYINKKLITNCRKLYSIQ